MSIFSARHDWLPPRPVTLTRRRCNEELGFTVRGEAPVIVATVDDSSPAQVCKTLLVFTTLYRPTQLWGMCVIAQRRRKMYSWTVWNLSSSSVCRGLTESIFKPPPPVGAGGGYMFSVVRPCRCLCVRASVHASVRPSVRDSRGSFVSAISPVSVDGFSPNFCHWCILGHR